MPTTRSDPGDRLLTPAEVAAMFRVDAKTVSRWGSYGKLPSLLTPGGHRRFRDGDVRAALAAGAESYTEDDVQVLADVLADAGVRGIAAGSATLARWLLDRGYRCVAAGADRA